MSGARLLAAALAIACVTGCGDDATPPAPTQPAVVPLTAQERRSADRSVAEIRAYCRDVARYLARGGPRPADDDAIAAARRIAALGRVKPEARYRGSQTARDLTADLAEDLEGTNCSQVLVVELERGL